MQDISLHLLDILENSIRADASVVNVCIEINKRDNRLKIMVTDNGHGMSEDILMNSQNPFFTTKENRVKKVGLGIPLFKQNAEHCDGSFNIISAKNKGTEIVAEFRLDHIDRMPLGSIPDTILTSLLGHPDIEFIVEMIKISSDGEKSNFIFDTKDIKQELDGFPINNPEVTGFIRDYLTEGINNIYKEEI
ncbi:MAG: ATP-binding protein [Candidatus Cloacimonetes bacterium]|nr:ATP-binding protein [Candidatus Cloacimonadota bacterium]